MNDYEILASAIADVGYWSWWAAKIPDFVQIEFGWTQLWSSPIQVGAPPTNQIALKFKAPQSIVFLTHKNAPHDFPKNWPDLLHEDKLEAPSIDYDHFTFTDTNIMREILKDASHINLYHGINPQEPSFWDCKIKLAFWAGNTGFMIAAESLTLVNREGEIPIKKVGEMNKKWWEYWRKYWDARDSSNPFPKDNLCEVTIPLKKES